MTNKLTTFLLGTTDHHSPLQILRGKGDILRIIWIYACSEWWSYHIQQYQIPHLYDPCNNLEESDPDNIADLRNHQLFTRKKFFDCPLAIVQDNVSFPPLGSDPDSDVGEPISVNMMPFDLFDPVGTLPAYLYGYLELIESCRKYVKAYSDMQYDSSEGSWRSDGTKRVDYTDPKNRIAYLTVDERPVSEAGRSQRRGGVHVESPGALREAEIANKSKYTPDLSYYHPWGSGFATTEYLVGGIFIASNVSDTTAVWNTRIHDTFGDIIGPHGSLERMRELLGPPTKRLVAGELVWLSDRTPHESLPLTDTSVRRQFFRLVVGEIGLWFADHNTLNPTGYPVPESVPIIHGNKFEVVGRKVPVVWECGDRKEIAVAREEVRLREKLYEVGVGFIADELLKIGIYNHELLRDHHDKWQELVMSLLDEYYYSPETRRFIYHSVHSLLYNEDGDEIGEDEYGEEDENLFQQNQRQDELLLAEDEDDSWPFQEDFIL